MNRLCAVALLLMLCVVQVRGATPRHPDELEIAPIDFKRMDVQSETLANGIPVYIFENHDLPLVRVAIRFRMGTRYLPVERFAASKLMGAVWRDGGTRELPPDSLDQVLVERNISINGFVGDTSGGVSMSCVRDDLDAALAYWRDILLEPRFDAKRLERAKGKRQKSLEQINNDPGRIADWRFTWLVGGSDRREIYPESKAAIAAVDAKDLRDLHERFIHPLGALIGVSGDIEPDEAVALLNALLEGWSGSPGFRPPEKPERVPMPEPGVYVLPGDYAQSQIRMGRRVSNLTELDPELASARLQNFALGYGRVYYRTRQEGLSYGCGVLLSVGNEGSGLKALGSCRPEVTLQLLQTVREEVARCETEPLTAAEVEAAKAFFIGQAIKQNELASSLVNQKLNDLINGRPADHFDRYFAALGAADSVSVNRCAREFSHMNDSLVVVVVGDPDKFEAPLDSLGLGPVVQLEPHTFGQ
jgi:zinc protease